MTIQNTISTIQNKLIAGFAALDSWLDRSDLLLRSNGTWTRLQVVEHVMLTNHFLLKLIEKGSDRAIERAAQLDMTTLTSEYRFDVDQMLSIARPGAFRWESPRHMKPSGTLAPDQIRRELRDQLYRCLITLDSLSEGQGLAYKLTMSVNNLGKLDMYQYLFFLALHIERHLGQLNNETFSGETQIEFPQAL